MKEVVMKVDDEFWDHITQLTVFKEQKEIIHCKDCKYAEKFNEQWFICRQWYPPRLDKETDTTVSADDFCSRGERK